MVGSRTVHGGGVHQWETRHRGEHPAGNRLHQQRLVRKTRGMGWIGLFNSIRCFLSFQQKLFDWNGAAFVERHKDPSGR